MLDKFFEMKGVVAAGVFSQADGSLLMFKGDMDKSKASDIAKMCYRNTKLFTKQAEKLQKITNMTWTPLKGWAFTAGDYSICIIDQFGVFVKTAHANFDDIFLAMRMVSEYKFDIKGLSSK
jgi:roadblock/LC7 domain-containing protein